MTLIAKRDSKVEQAVQELDAVCEKHGIALVVHYSGLAVQTQEGKTYLIQNLDSGPATLPRCEDDVLMLARSGDV